MKYSLRISGKHYDTIRAHLFPGDDLEAIAFAICGRHKTDNIEVLMVHKVIPIPYELCNL